MSNEAMKLDQALDRLRTLATLREKVKALEDELVRAVMLCELFGTGIFKHGAVKTKTVWVGRSIMFTATTGNGETLSTDLKDVPVELWPEHVIDQVRLPAAFNTFLPDVYRRKYREWEGRRK